MSRSAWSSTLLLVLCLGACSGDGEGGADGGALPSDAKGGDARGADAGRDADGAAGIDGAPAVEQPPRLLGAPPPAVAGQPYRFTLRAAGGRPPWRFGAAVVSPDGQGNGLTLDPDSGVLSGTPLFSGELPLLIEVGDGQALRSSLQTLLVVDGEGAGHAFSGAPPGAVQGSPYAYTFVAPWSSILGCVVSLYQVWGKVPPGLALEPLGGVLEGTPLTAGRYSFAFYADPATVACSQSEPTQTNVTTFTLDVAPAAAASSPPGASDWRVAEGGPVLEPTTGSWDEDHLTAPAVLRVGGTYYLYYEGQGGPTHQRQIGLATSDDGVRFTKVGGGPVLAVGAAGAWDGLEVRLPAVHHDGAQFRMWYFGRQDVGDRGAVGLATSPDGISWTRRPQPVFGASGGFNEGIAPGQVLGDAGGFTLYYVDDAGAFGRATSVDGVVWVDGGALAYDAPPSHRFSRPAVIDDGGTLRMWYMRRGDSISNQALSSTVPHDLGGQVLESWSANAIAHARSSDGGNSWSLYEGNPVLVGQSGWAGPGVAYPTALREGERFRMWFAAGPVRDGSARGVIGLASATP